MFSLLFGRYLRAESLCHIVCLCFMFLKILPDCFPKWLSYFTVILTMQESSHCSKSAPTLTVCHADQSHISEWEMVSHHGFDLYFFNWFVFLMTNDVMHHYICLLASHLYIFLGEICIRILGLFFNWVVYYYWLVRVLFYIPDTNPLVKIRFENISSSL